MSSTFDPVTAVLLVLVAFERVVQPILVFPPDPVAFYDAYVGLNPMVSTFLAANVLFLAQIPLLLVASNPFRMSRATFPCSVLALACLYAVHAPLSSDNATHGTVDHRLLLMTWLALLWAAAYLLSERAQVLRFGNHTESTVLFVQKRLGWLPVRIFSLGMAWSRSLLAFFLLSPMYFVWITRGSPLTYVDFILAFLFAVSTLIKYVLQRQWAYKSDMGRCAPTSGLNLWVRHPEIVAEISTWASFLGYAIQASNFPRPWPALGLVWYALLLVTSTAFADRIAGSEYLEYRTYKSKVWMLLPCPPRLTGMKDIVAHTAAAESKKSK